MGLLKGIHPLLTADLLFILRSMGHGDKIAVVDCNFPAASVASKTDSGRCIILTVPLPEALSAICSVLPLDLFVEFPVNTMSPSSGMVLPPAGVEVLDGICAVISEHTTREILPLERFDFYAQAKGCYAIVQTLERRPYGNVILQKGVVGPDGKDLHPSTDNDV
jgi:L-fucose mutarotase